MSKSNKNQEVAVLEQTDETRPTEVSIETKVKEIAADKNKNVSYRIRELAGLGLKMGPIVKALTEGGYKTKNGTDIRFQHVRNVLMTPAKKS